MQEETKKGYNEYCAGLPFIGMRKISEREITYLRKEENAYLRNFIIWLLVFSLIIISCIVSIAYGPHSLTPPFLDTVATIILILVIFIGLPVSFVIANDNYKDFKKIKGVIANGKVRCYEGSINVEDWTDDARVMFEKTGHLNNEPNAVNAVELFSDRNLLYKINGHRVKKCIDIELTYAANTPDASSYYSLPKEWDAPEECHLLRRKLTDDEKLEIRSYIKYARRKQWRVMFWLSFSGAVIIRPVTLNIIGLTARECLIAILGYVLIVCVYVYWTTRNQSRKYDGDYNNGWAVILDPTKSETEFTDKLGRKLKVPMEILPISESIWTIENKPAGWRGAGR